MTEQFDVNLSLVLAHSVLHFAKAEVPENIPHDWAKNWSNDPDIPSVGEATGSVSSSMVGNYPNQANTIANANLDIAQRTAPAYAQLAWDTAYAQMPKFSWLQSDMYRNNAPTLAQAEAAATQSVLDQYGQNLVGKTLTLDQMLNPEYYAMRGQASNTIGQLMSGQLTDAEREAISRQILGGNVDRGVVGINSPINTVSNAMLFGDAARQRQVQGAQMATSFLPVSRSGLDASGIALGNKDWQSKFLGVGDTSGVTGATRQVNDASNSWANNVLSGVYGLSSQNAQSQADASTPWETTMSAVNWA